MKPLALTLVLAGPLSGGIDYGYVESAMEVRIDAPAQGALADAFEHAVKPQTAGQLLIRVDDGRAVILQPEQLQRFQPGERVRILWDSDGTRVERD